MLVGCSDTPKRYGEGRDEKELESTTMEDLIEMSRAGRRRGGVECAGSALGT